MDISELRRQITEYMRQGLIMPDVEQSAKECQERIDRMGIKWDKDRMLWRKPEED